MSSVMTGTVCDHGGCPAAGTHQTLIHSQDFYFCAHHASELAPALSGLSASAPTGLRLRRTSLKAPGGAGGSPPVRQAADRV